MFALDGPHVWEPGNRCSCGEAEGDIKQSPTYPLPLEGSFRHLDLGTHDSFVLKDVEQGCNGWITQ